MPPVHSSPARRRGHTRHVDSIVVSTRRMLARRPWIQWVLIATLAVAITASVHDRLRQIDARRDSWGSTRTVFVADRSTAVGEPLHVRPLDVPVAVIPAAAITEGSDIVDAMARQSIGEGEIVTRTDVTAGTGAQAMTPAGWLAVPIVEATRSGATVGDRVQVASDGFVVSADALVVAQFDEVTVLAVPAAEAPLLPAAAEASTLTLLLQP
jgi:hypothetical protein